MPLDPAAEVLLAGLEAKLAGVDGVATDLAARATALRDNVTNLRAVLTGGAAPPPPPTSTPVTIVTVATSRPDAATVAVNWVLAGTMSRVTKIAVSVVPGGWQEFPVPANPVVGTVKATQNVKAAAGTLYFHVWDAGLKGGVGDWVKFTAAYDAAVVVVTPPVTPPVDPPPPPPPGSGVFTFKADTNGTVSLYDGGKLFIPIGVNVPGPNGYWGGGFTPIGKAARLRQQWGWNFIRLFEQRATGGDADYTPSAHNPYTIAQVVDEYTVQGFVVMLDWHQYGFGATLNQAKTDEMIAVHTGWANQFKSNPRVWFELCNEPESSYGAGAFNEAACFDRWYQFQAPVIKAIRATGAPNMIVVNDAQSGQGCTDFWAIGPSSGSAIMTRGAQLLAQDPTGNLMWDTHFYDAFGWGGPGEEHNDCSNRYTDQQRNARVLDYIDRVHKATGRPTLAGEFGWQNGESATTGAGFHYPYTTCGSRTLRAQQAFTRAALARNCGGTQWPGFQLSTTADAYATTQPTACGLDWMAYCRAASAKMAATASVTGVDDDGTTLVREMLAVANQFHVAQLTMPQRKTTANVE